MNFNIIFWINVSGRYLVKLLALCFLPITKSYFIKSKIRCLVLYPFSNSIGVLNKSSKSLWISFISSLLSLTSAVIKVLLLSFSFLISILLILQVLDLSSFYNDYKWCFKKLAFTFVILLLLPIVFNYYLVCNLNR